MRSSSAPIRAWVALWAVLPVRAFAEPVVPEGCRLAGTALWCTPDALALPAGAFVHEQRPDGSWRTLGQIDGKGLLAPVPSGTTAPPPPEGGEAPDPEAGGAAGGGDPSGPPGAAAAGHPASPSAAEAGPGPAGDEARPDPASGAPEGAVADGSAAFVVPDSDKAALLGLLTLWLATRWTSRRKAPGTALPPRAAHQHAGLVTPVEVARAVFEAARSHDFDAYRALFLSGGDAGHLFGIEGAESYLERRSPAHLDASFRKLLAAVDSGAVYAGLEEGEDGLYRLVTRAPGGEPRHAPIGTLVRVRGLWKIQDPPG